MSGKDKPVEKVLLEVHDTDMTTGMIRKSYSILLESPKESQKKLQKDALDLLDKLRSEKK